MRGLTPRATHNSGSVDVREQCAWCLGNIAGDCTELRDLVLQHGAMQPLIANIMQPENATILRNATWTLSNFCRDKPRVAMDRCERSCLFAKPKLRSSDARLGRPRAACARRPRR